MTSARPFLKWAGGKTQLLPDLLRHAPPQFDCYYEPFLGGGALFFALQTRHAVACTLCAGAQGKRRLWVLSDSNAGLIEAYQVVQREVEALIARLRRYRATRETFYRIRAQDPGVLSPVERAARFIYLNRTCYNGLHRVNRHGQFNVPFGRYKNPRICDAASLRAASQALRQATLRAGDFAECAGDARAGDLLYFDPPFDPLSRTASFTSYTAGASARKTRSAWATRARRWRRGAAISC